MTKKFFKPYDPRVNWDMFGYAGYCCQAAIRSNNPDAAEECWRRGWMDLNSRMLIGTVLSECERRAPEVAKRLRKLGPCKNEPMPESDFAEKPADAVAA